MKLDSSGQIDRQCEGLVVRFRKLLRHTSGPALNNNPRHHAAIPIHSKRIILNTLEDKCLTGPICSPIKDEQDGFRAMIRGRKEYYSIIYQAYIRNPFLRLQRDELEYLTSNVVPAPIRSLIAARAAATEADTPKFVVFCMPKSGSSFTQSALHHALDLPPLSTTSIAPPAFTSALGMNAREQEFDELAILTATLRAPRGYIAQNHTRCSPHLSLQIKHHGIFPILTIRNVLDCIVSFDDMMMQWRSGNHSPAWMYDAQFALPTGYTALAAHERYDLLARSFGIWLLSFYLSWSRCRKQGLVSPLVLKYEEDILDGERFVERLGAALALSPDQLAKLSAYVANPDREKSRLNVGRAGRGRELIPESVADFLIGHARLFRDEISDAEMDYLLGPGVAAPGH